MNATTREITKELLKCQVHLAQLHKAIRRLPKEVEWTPSQVDIMKENIVIIQDAVDEMAECSPA